MVLHHFPQALEDHQWSTMMITCTIYYLFNSFSFPQTLLLFPLLRILAFLRVLCNCTTGIGLTCNEIFCINQTQKLYKNNINTLALSKPFSGPRYSFLIFSIGIQGWQYPDASEDILIPLLGFWMKCVVELIVVLVRTTLGCILRVLSMGAKWLATRWYDDSWWDCLVLVVGDFEVRSCHLLVLPKSILISRNLFTKVAESRVSTVLVLWNEKIFTALWN